MQNNHQRSQGFALSYILMAVVLLGAVTALIANSSKGSVQANYSSILAQIKTQAETMKQVIADCREQVEGLTIPGDDLFSGFPTTATGTTGPFSSGGGKMYTDVNCVIPNASGGLQNVKIFEITTIDSPPPVAGFESENGHSLWRYYRDEDGISLAIGLSATAPSEYVDKVMIPLISALGGETAVRSICNNKVIYLKIAKNYGVSVNYHDDDYQSIYTSQCS